MTTITTRQSAMQATLFEAALVLRTLTAQLQGALQRFSAHWEARARAGAAIRELTSLSDRDLRDMGLSRCDIPRLAEEERSWRGS
jgi:uncharacterized protein YjiS (DUF1127 family)